jgi:CHAD domain-containing protein
MNPALTYISYLEKRLNNIRMMVGPQVNVYNTAYFHRLRVEIKKLNASLKLLKSCSSKFQKKKYFQPYKLLNIKAGEIREIQLEEIALKKFKPNSFTKIFLPYLKLRRMVKKKQFLAIKTGFALLPLNKSHATIYSHSKKLNRNKLGKYFSSLKGEIIQRLTVEVLKPKTIHELRILLKEFYYNLSITEPGEKNEFKKTNFLQDLIGRWHDFTTIINHLNLVKHQRSMNQRNTIQLERVKVVLAGNAAVLLMKIHKEKNAALLELSQKVLH